MRTRDEINIWRRQADHYARLADEHPDASAQLACYVLANYCVYQWSGEHGGPTEEMVRLAKEVLGVNDCGQHL